MSASRCDRRGESISVHVDIAEHCLVFVCETAALADSLRILLVHHLTKVSGSSRAEPPIVIELFLDPDAPPSRLRCVGRGHSSGGAWQWIIASAAAADLPNRFYYWVVLPILNRVLAARGTIGMHAALLAAEGSSGVLVFGDSGAGKSTTAAAWLGAGGSLLSDDTLFARKVGAHWHYFGLRRPLHLAQDVTQHLGSLTGLGEALEYLPQRRKLSYDCWAAYPSRHVDKVDGIRCVLLSSVGANRTRIRPASHEHLCAALSTSLSANGASVRSGVEHGLARGLTASSVWHVAWGPDIWSRTNHHHRVINHLIASPPHVEPDTSSHPLPVMAWSS